MKDSRRLFIKRAALAGAGVIVARAGKPMHGVNLMTHPLAGKT